MTTVLHNTPEVSKTYLESSAVFVLQRSTSSREVPGHFPNFSSRRFGSPIAQGHADQAPQRRTDRIKATPNLSAELAGQGIVSRLQEAAVSEQTDYRWRKEYGGLKLAQTRKLKELERENARLKRIVADLSLEKTMLKEVASGNW